MQSFKAWLGKQPYSLPPTLTIRPLDLGPLHVHPPPHQLGIVTPQLFFVSVHSIQLYRQGQNLILHVLDEFLLLPELFITVFEFALEKSELTVYGGELLGQGGVGRSEGGVCGLRCEKLGAEGGAGGLGGAEVLTQASDLIVASLI